jgi:hexosaminidase
MPSELNVGVGEFVFTNETVLAIDPDVETGAMMTAYIWADEFRAATGFELPLADATQNQNRENVVFMVIDEIATESSESYELSVTPESIRITAPAANGLFYGLQTLKQLMPPEIETIVDNRDANAEINWSVPAVDIQDAPRFAYRGMHLDVGRYFFDVEFIKRYIDLMARYKMNYFHWGLTQDQGWRIEINKYPLLTEVASKRPETMLEKNFSPYVGDGIPHEGFYTQDQIREVVIYAETKFVTVIPEIEMPGHSAAAIAAYPELACTDGPFEVPTTWGVKSEILCPSEFTFTFLAEVLNEVISLFPSEYIHIGADEVPKARWENSELAQRIIRENGLADEQELQSWFIKRIESYLNSRNKRLIGWDEILEGGLAPDATVMSWRGIDGGIEAARQGHDAIMTPTQYAYFDYYQGDKETEPLAIGGYLPLDSVYVFEPVPAELTPDEAKHIIGAQGNVWTEYISTPSHAEYMAFPRALAMAEVTWSSKENRDWASFKQRLTRNLDHLRALGVNFRPLD